MFKKALSFAVAGWLFALAFTFASAADILPSAPTNVKATAGNGSATVTFTPGSMGSGTLVNYWAACGVDTTHLVKATGSKSPITVTGLTNGTVYYCWALTESTVGYSSNWSTVSNSVTPTSVTSILPSAPTNVTATAGNGSATVAFTPGSIGSGTLVNYWAACDKVGDTVIGNANYVYGSSSPITVTGLSNGTAYSCGALTRSTVGDSAWSTRASPVTPTSAPAASVPVVEFYNTNLDNYFITADAYEAAAIDNGSAGPGWSRTGNTFTSGGSTFVCRFYGSLSPGPNSHFYTVDSGECNYLKQLQASTPATQKRWNFESLDFVSTPSTNGTCPSGTLPVYRAYNNGSTRGVDSNHRITTNLTAIQQVAACGWKNEGVVMCATNGTSSGGTTSCGGSNAVGVFQYGTPTTYSISGTTEKKIYDALSGNTFRFPNGGNGTLTITPITATPVAGPVSGSSFKVEYSSTDTMQLLIPHNANEVPLLWLWGDPAVSIYESNGPAEMWMPLLSVDNTSNPAIFELLLSGNSANANTKSTEIKVLTPSNSQGMRLLAAKLNKNDGVFERLGKLRDLATQDIQKIVDLLPTGVQQKAVAEINGRLHAKLDGFYELYSDKSYYHPFSYITGRADPYFVLVATTVGGGMLANEYTVAHEVGHYMSHVLVGDDGMRILKNQAHREHGKGTSHVDRPMLEEYAYFSDYCINYENPSANRASIENFFDIATGKPDTQDWPSEEGYATSLLALMHTDNASRGVTRSGDPEEIPLIQASLPDLWGILAKGPLTVNALYADIVDYLSPRGNLDKLAPLLERSGWSYHGEGTLVDDQKKAMPFAMVQAVAKVANKEYLAPLAPVKADDKGKFTLDRIFPGSNFIRVWPQAGASPCPDLALTVDPANPTNGKLALGTIELVGCNPQTTFSKNTTWTERVLLWEKPDWTSSFSGTVSGPIDLAVTEENASTLFDPSEGDQWTVYRITTKTTGMPITVEGKLITTPTPSSGRDFPPSVNFVNPPYLDWSFTDPQLWATDKTGDYAPSVSNNFKFILSMPYGFGRACYTYNYKRSYFDGKKLTVYPAARVSRGCVYFH